MANINFCEKLSGQKCVILGVKCHRLQTKEQCDLPYHYKYLTKVSSDPQLAKRIKQKILPDVIEKWKDYAINPRPGKKDMTGGPLEKGIRMVLKDELSPLGATVSYTGKRFFVWENVPIIADCIIEKSEKPSTILSIKSWIGCTQIRETFGYAYLSKTWLGQKNIRIYMISLQPIEDLNKSLINACKPYIDGVYSLSGDPYIDELLTELKRIYR
ncbi:hypothetical protein KEJ37_05355 [Candidatus Bathyarchaeota archaeon]|nr:hypothetical protein [Candidatus Bathyarchaeota archaeon]